MTNLTQRMKARRYKHFVKICDSALASMLVESSDKDVNKVTRVLNLARRIANKDGREKISIQDYNMALESMIVDKK